ncbi:MAG: hypothetical protein Q9172_005516 [Xanthocarpia lactea]
MGKKRKASGQKPGKQKTNGVSKDDSRQTIDTYEDVADSEDEFFINRDKVLLDEGPIQKKRRKIEEEDALLEPSDEEVLAEPSDASISADEDPQEDGAAFSPKLIPQRAGGQSLKYASDASDAAAPEEDEEYNWGTSRKDYYNADPITTEADALEEEAEARRLQKKQLQGMTEADFGFDEVDWTLAGKDDGTDGTKGKVVTEVLPALEITDSMSPEEKLKILRMRYPEFEPLAKEYIDLQAVYEDLSLASKATSAVTSTFSTGNSGASTVAAVKLNALGSYLAALCMYFALLSATDTNSDNSSGTMAPSELHDHKIMDTLVKCRQLWEKVKDMEIPELQPLEVAATDDHQTSADGGETAIKNQHATEVAPKPRKRKSQSAKKAARALATAQAESEARRLERLRQTEESLKDLSALPSLSQASTRVSSAAGLPNGINDGNDSDLGDPTTLTPQEASQKALRKKSLRFYTSQIAQKSNKRDAAGRDAGGDADIPHRERLKDRQQRLNAEAEARGRKGKDGGAPLDDINGQDIDGGADDDNDEQGQLAREVRNDGDDGYYDLVASRAADKKALKAAQAQAAREGGVVRIVDDEDVGEDGKRGITYAIEKNKGLTPKRKKEVRNPRLKKRLKYEDKKKKLGSVRAVYKGGEASTLYKAATSSVFKLLIPQLLSVKRRIAMSFGWSVSDIALLVRLAYKTSQGARAACGQYDELTRETSSLHVILNRLNVEASRPGNPIDKDQSHGKELGVIASGCKDVLTQLDEVLVKYNALSEQEKSVRRLWKKVKFGNGVVADVAVLRSKVTYYTSSLTLFLNMVSLGSIGAVEEKMDRAGGDLQEIKNAVNHITAHLMATADEEGSVLTAHTNDDRGAWRELRRQLLKGGFRDSLIRRHMDLIMAYVKELGDRGVLDSINIDESVDGGAVPTSRKRVPPATDSDFEDIAYDQKFSRPVTPKQQDVHERDDHPKSQKSDTVEIPTGFHESSDVRYKLFRMYGNNRMPKFMSCRHNATFYEVDPSVSEPVAAFYFRYISISPGPMSWTLKRLRKEAHRLIEFQNNTLDAYTQQYLGNMKKAGGLHALCRAFSVNLMSANGITESSVQALKDMMNWINFFDESTQCRAIVDARWKRFSVIRYGDYGGTEYMKSLYGYPRTRDFETSDFWRKIHERNQEKAANILKSECLRFLDYKYSGARGKPTPYILAHYELPAFVAGPKKIYKMDEVRAISESRSFLSPESPYSRQVRLLDADESREVAYKSLAINTIQGNPGTPSDICWTPNGLAVLALHLIFGMKLNHIPLSEDIERILDSERFTILCRMLAIHVLEALNALEQGPNEITTAIVPFQKDPGFHFPGTIEFGRSKTRPGIRIHRSANNATS